MYIMVIINTLSRPSNGVKEIKDPPVRTKPELDPDLLVSIDIQLLTDSYVYVHCYFQNEWQDALVRIWKTTFLIDQGSGFKSALMHAENISIAPLWTLIPDNTTHNFLLIFEALPKSCSHFDLIEEIPQPGGFHVKNIQRNQKDVYHITL